jgi:hypothetical protein
MFVKFHCQLAAKVTFLPRISPSNHPMAQVQGTVCVLMAEFPPFHSLSTALNMSKDMFGILNVDEIKN